MTKGVTFWGCYEDLSQSTGRRKGNFYSGHSSSLQLTYHYEKPLSKHVKFNVRKTHYSWNFIREIDTISQERSVGEEWELSWPAGISSWDPFVFVLLVPSSCTSLWLWEPVHFFLTSWLFRFGTWWEAQGEVTGDGASCPGSLLTLQGEAPFPLPSATHSSSLSHILVGPLQSPTRQKVHFYLTEPTVSCQTGS